MRFLTLACTISAAVILSASATAQGTTWYVDVNGVAPGTGTAFDPYTSIDYAVHQATTVSGDTVLVLPGVYEETVEIVNKGIVVMGREGAVETIIDARGKGTVVTVVGVGRDSTPLLKGFTITNGTGTLRNGHKIGGGILAEDTVLEVQNCIITSNEAVLGGGVGATASELDMYDCEIRSNVASNAMWCGPADGHGGGLYIAEGGGITLTQCGIRWNLAALGGGLYGDSVYVAMNDVPIRENKVHGMDFEEHVAAGGGLFMAAGELWMRDSLVQANRATGFEGLLPHGGGLYIGEAVEGLLADVQFIDNLASDPVTRALGMGGAIATESARLEGRGLLFLENWAGTAGGGVWGPATLRDSTFTGNWAHGQGGGAWGARLFDCVLSANTVIPLEAWTSTWGAGAYGGYLENCVLKDNIAYGHEGLVDPASFGGGAYGATLMRTQVFDNQADFGGGLAQCEADHVTVYSNTALVDGGGGGLFFMGRSGSTSNSIVWNNRNGQIVDFSSGAPVTYTNVEGNYPGLGNHEGNPRFWNPDMHDFNLKPGSFCINAGDPVAPPDPDGSVCDMGALTFDATYCGAPSTYCRAKVNSMDCAPVIGFEGSPSLTGSDDFLITASQILNGRNGLLIWSYRATDLPFRGGTLCVQPPFRRTPVQSSGGSAQPATDCSGTFSYLFSQSEMVGGPMAMGRTFFAQYVYRDEGYLAPENVGLTGGLRVTVCP